ncbi:MAG: serine protease [Clostridia bacterium]|nr:serine protease [Clostridia bacterium]
MKIKYVRILQIALFLLAAVCIAILFAGCDSEHSHTWDNGASDWVTYDETYHMQECDCGEVNYEAHSWDNGVVTAEATHLQTGVMTYTCTVCGETKTETIAKITEHTYSDWKTSDEAYHQKVCECGDIQYEEHIWNSGVVTTEATHTQTGVMTYTCTVCGETKTETIAKTTEHSYSDWKTCDETNHQKVCECGDVQYEAHSWDNGVVTAEATHLQTGVMTYTCTVCGETKTETIAKTTEHTYSDWKTCDETNHQKVCECGDIQYEEHSLVYGTCEVCGYVDESYIPDTSYFVGNVFQIVVLDLGKQAIALGTGFVINEEGYFITNSHVMEDAYYAYALFEIVNMAEGESFTKLEINLGGYNNADKDIFVGKIENYSSISAYYNDIKIATEYEVGETTYSVGYPSGTAYMQVNKGVVQDKYTYIYDKLNGVEYVVSTSYIMFGSSGGILLNGNLEIIGMTTLVELDDNDEFVYSYAISALNFSNHVTNAATYDYTNLARFLHPEYTEYIDFFEAISEDENAYYYLDEYGIVYYYFVFTGEGTNSSGYGYTYTEFIEFSSYFSIVY